VELPPKYEPALEKLELDSRAEPRLELEESAY
jgi:hypothetical protein